MVGLLKVAVFQIDVKLGDPEYNRSKVRVLLEKVKFKRPDVVVLPEMWDISYDLKNIKELSVLEGPKTIKFIMDMALRFQVNIVAGSIALNEKGKIYNASLVFSREGKLLGIYRKVHLFGLMNEDKAFERGKELGLFDLEGIRCGLMICYDIRFPELARALALKGAQIIFVPAQWPLSRLSHWKTLLQARAIENQLYIVAANRYGQEGKIEFAGNSLVIDPWGEIIAGGSELEAIVFAEINIDKVKEVRERIPVFKDRAPEVYGLS
ncbi:MAG: carbon-nitrogen family hydrolase [Synergistetes bacterium]|nr:carbon-nitrogen family hydrolase [Synergistota bacterium]